MLESQKQQIVDAALAYLAEHKPEGMSQAKLATQAGINQGYLSQMLTGKWNSAPIIGDQWFRKLQVVLGISLEVFPTKNYMDILITLDEAKRNTSKEMLAYRLIDGNTGAGKTFAIAEFQRQFPTSTYVVKCSNSMSARIMVKRMAEVVGVSDTGDNNTIIGAVAAKMNREGNAIMIFDESETMVKKASAYGYIKDLYDAVHEQSAIVIIGANGILDKLKMKASYNVESFPQVVRRFCANPIMLSEGIAIEDAVNICAAFDITARRDVNSLVGICDSYGTLFSKLKKMKSDQEALISAA